MYWKKSRQWEKVYNIFLIATSTSCSEVYAVEIELDLLEQSGNYVKFCLSSLDNEPIYKHESDDFYLSHISTNVNFNFWAISERINGSLVAGFLGINSASINCPDSLYTPIWFAAESMVQTVDITVTMTIPGAV